MAIIITIIIIIGVYQLLLLTIGFRGQSRLQHLREERCYFFLNKAIFFYILHILR